MTNFSYNISSHFPGGVHIHRYFKAVEKISSYITAYDLTNGSNGGFLFTAGQLNFSVNGSLTAEQISAVNALDGQTSPPASATGNLTLAQLAIEAQFMPVGSIRYVEDASGGLLLGTCCYLNRNRYWCYVKNDQLVPLP